MHEGFETSIGDRLGRWCAENVAVALIHVNSGPGRAIGACLPHAREYAAYPLAPERRLRDDLAGLDQQ